jgi:CRP-like cAMP-binding protein
MDLTISDALVNSLQKTGNFSQHQVQQILQQCTVSSLDKNEVLLKEGQVCQSVYFILQGSFYQYKQHDGDERIVDLHIEHEWMLHHSSFIGQKPADATIKCYAAGTVAELTVHSVHNLIEISPAFFQMGKILEPSRSRLNILEDALTPRQKYDFVLRERPRLLHCFPLKFIASYLRITPETLSRVRSQP